MSINQVYDQGKGSSALALQYRGEMNMIKMEGVSKSYSTGTPALNNVSLHIKKGEFVFIGASPSR